ncbi:hypothetical protein H7J88_19070 [Mycolicibacterium flavescens]|nr:hypothetical protein [Mycolicibacterium flavescens]
MPGPGISRIRLKKIPEGGAHIDVPAQSIGAWQTADTMGFFEALPELWPGWRTERWDDRYENHVAACGPALGVPGLDLVEGVDVAEAWIRERVFESYADSPAGQLANLAGMLAPLAPGLEVGADALTDFAVRPTTAEWARFEEACARLRDSRAA